MNNVNQIRIFLVATLCVFVLAIPIRGLDPNQAATSFLRTHFTPDEGLPGAVVDKIEQTPDGFLWLVTNSINLVRFDGKSFYQFEPRARTLAVAPDGDLWVGTSREIMRIPSSNLNQFTLSGLTYYHPGPGKASDVICLRFSSTGVLWIGTVDGLFCYEGSQFVAVGPGAPTREIEVAPDGHLMVITADGFVELTGSDVVTRNSLIGWVTDGV